MCNIMSANKELPRYGKKKMKEKVEGLTPLSQAFDKLSMNTLCINCWEGAAPDPISNYTTMFSYPSFWIN
jgi:hypothetical protein